MSLCACVYVYLRAFVHALRMNPHYCIGVYMYVCMCVGFRDVFRAYGGKTKGRSLLTKSFHGGDPNHTVARVNRTTPTVMADNSLGFVIASVTMRILVLHCPRAYM